MSLSTFGNDPVLHHAGVEISQLVCLINDFVKKYGGNNMNLYLSCSYEKYPQTQDVLYDSF